MGAGVQGAWVQGAEHLVVAWLPQQGLEHLGGALAVEEVAHAAIDRGHVLQARRRVQLRRKRLVAEAGHQPRQHAGRPGQCNRLAGAWIEDVGDEVAEDGHRTSVHRRRRIVHEHAKPLHRTMRAQGCRELLRRGSMRALDESHQPLQALYRCFCVRRACQRTHQLRGLMLHLPPCSSAVPHTTLERVTAPCWRRF